MSTWVKVCGCTSIGEVVAVADAGADAVGFIFAPSPRRIEIGAFEQIAASIPERLAVVAVVADVRPDDLERMRAAVPRLMVQFSAGVPNRVLAAGDARTIAVIHVDTQGTAELERHAARHPNATLLFDRGMPGLLGGSGATFDWSRVAPIVAVRRAIVAGGLRPGNVGQCIRILRPYGVDVRSGVERDGRKDPAMIRAFVKAVRDADAA